MNNISSLIQDGHSVNYKLLSIGTFKYDGVTYVQVHCDRRDLEYSFMYSINELKKAIGKYFYLYNKYIASENKYGDFPPISENEGKKYVPK